MVPTEVPLALDSEAGQLVRAMQVQCGAQHTLVLVQTRGASQVRSAGGNSYGELGLGDRLERHRFHPIPALLVSWGVRLEFGAVWARGTLQRNRWGVSTLFAALRKSGQPPACPA